MPPSKKGSMGTYFFLIEKYVYILIKEAYFLFQSLHRGGCGGVFGHSLKDLGVKVGGHSPIGQLACGEVDDVDHTFLRILDGIPHLRRDIDLLGKIMFVLATDGCQQDSLHLIGRQFRIIHSENELVGLDALEEHGHTFVGLKAHGEHMVLGLVLQIEKAFPLFIFNELANDQVGRHRENERRYYRNDNDERC